MDKEQGKHEQHNKTTISSQKKTKGQLVKLAKHGAKVKCCPLLDEQTAYVQKKAGRPNGSFIKTKHMYKNKKFTLSTVKVIVKITFLIRRFLRHLCITSGERTREEKCG
jgi:hypothetical protein